MVCNTLRIILEAYICYIQSCRKGEEIKVIRVNIYALIKLIRFVDIEWEGRVDVV